MKEMFYKASPFFFAWVLSSCEPAKASNQTTTVATDILSETCVHEGEAAATNAVFSCSTKLLRVLSSAVSGASATKCIIVYVENCKGEGANAGSVPQFERMQFLYNGDTASADPVVAFFTTRAVQSKNFKIAFKGSVVANSAMTRLSVSLDTDGTVILE